MDRGPDFGIRRSDASEDPSSLRTRLLSTTWRAAEQRSTGGLTKLGVPPRGRRAIGEQLDSATRSWTTPRRLLTSCGSYSMSKERRSGHSACVFIAVSVIHVIVGKTCELMARPNTMAADSGAAAKRCTTE
jgi:hypothetical protein